MMSILNFFWQLCLLRKSPADLPSSSFATAAIFLVYLCIALVIVSLTRPDQPLTQISANVAIGLSMQAAVTFALLQFKGLPNRFTATWSALLGANAIMLIVLFPFQYIILNADNRALIVFADSATWICLGWWLGIAGYIYHKAIEISILQGAIIAFLTELLGVIVAVSLFPR